MKGLLTLASVVMLGGSAGSVFFMTHTDQPVVMKEVRFCPPSMNINQENYRESQEALDNKFCRYKYLMSDEVWDEQEFSASLALPEGSFKTRDLPARLPDFTWFYYGIAGCGLAVLFAKTKVSAEINEAHRELEEYKTRITLDNTKERQTRQFTKDRLELDFDIQRVKSGLIDSAQLMKERKERDEIQDSMHDLSLTELEAQKSELRKKIAENLKAVKTAKGSAKNEEIKGKDALIQMMKDHEGGWLWDIMEFQKPLWVTGEAGSGKSTFLAAIVLCRSILCDMPLIELFDSHYGVNKNEQWKYLKPEKVYVTENEIAQGFKNSVERWSAKLQGITPIGSPVQMLVDEFTNHSISENEDLAKSANLFSRKSLSDPRKCNEYIGGISHGTTNTAKGGTDGASEMRKRGEITVCRKTNNGKTPLPNATITGIYDKNGDRLEDHPVTIPDWFQCKKIVKMLEIEE